MLFTQKHHQIKTCRCFIFFCFNMFYKQWLYITLLNTSDLHFNGKRVEESPRSPKPGKPNASAWELDSTFYKLMYQM